MAGTDLRQLPRNEMAVLAAGVVAFIVSFFPYYGASVHAGGFSSSVSVNAWHGTALLGLLFIFAATVVAAMQAFARESLPSTGLSWNFVVAALSVIGTILVFLHS